MNDAPIPLFAEPLSDEAAHALCEALNWLAITCENTYYAQIRRHLATLDEQRINPDQPWHKPSAHN